MGTVFIQWVSEAHHSLRASHTGVTGPQTQACMEEEAVEGVSCLRHLCEPGASRQTQVGLAGDKQNSVRIPSL